MSASAEFTIEGTPFSDGGFDRDEGNPVDLQIADAHVDIWKVQFSVAQLSKNAPAGSFTPSTGIAPTVGDVVSFDPGAALVAGAPFLFRIRCIVNNGVDRNGDGVDEYTKDRIIAIRNSLGLRAQLQGEQYEYDPNFGASSIYDEFALATVKQPAFARFTSGTPTLSVDIVNVLSGTVAGATLPPAAANDRRSVWVKKHNLGSINIGRSGSDTIDGATTYTMAAAYLATRFVADGTNNEWLSFP